MLCSRKKQRNLAFTMPLTDELLDIFSALDPKAREMLVATGRALLRRRPPPAKVRLALVPRLIPNHRQSNIDSAINDSALVRTAMPVRD